MSEHHDFALLGKFSVNAAWDGTPTTLQPNDNVNLPQTTTGSMVLLSQNTSGQNSTGQLTITSGGSMPVSQTLYGDSGEVTVLAQNWNGNNLSLTNTSLSGSQNPIWVSAVGPGLSGVTPVTLPTDGSVIALASGASAAGNASASWMQLVLQNTAGTLTLAVFIGGKPDASGSNAKVISLNDGVNGNTGPGTSTPAPAGYFATTSSNTYLYSFNYGSAGLFIASESPSTSADLSVALRKL